MKKASLFLALLLILPAHHLHASTVGESVYKHCKNCHGLQGEGGQEGRYPRIAGMPKDYIARQLDQFKSRKRLNKPMLPIFKNWRFNDEVMREVAGYVADMPLPALQLAFMRYAAHFLISVRNHSSAASVHLKLSRMYFTVAFSMSV